MKRLLLGFLKNNWKYLTVLACIALAVTVAVALLSRPVLTESITETLRGEDGAFLLDGLGPGSTDADVVAWLEGRSLDFYGGDLDDYYQMMRKQSIVLGTYNAGLPDTMERESSWITITGNTRIEELGKASVQRTYRFRNGELTSVELKVEPFKDGPKRGAARIGAVLDALTDAFGAPEAVGSASRLEKENGGISAAWQGAKDSRIDVSARRWAVAKRLDDVKEDPMSVPHSMWFEMTIRVTFSD